MEIAIKDHDGIKILTFNGELDTSTSPEAESVTFTLIEEGTVKMLFDFTNLEYISSSGLRIVLANAKKLSMVNGELRVCNLNETVTEVFEISGFNTIVKVFKSTEEALNDF